MKKITTLLLSAVVTLYFAYGQIPNQGFENWTSAGNYEDPDGWATGNPLSDAVGVYAVEKSTDSHSGTYAAKLTTKSFLSLITIPGAMGTGTIDASTYTFAGGFPLTTSPATFEGFVKYNPAGNDSSLLLAYLTKHNVSSTDTIAVAAYIIQNTISSYTNFAVPFYYFILGEVPDTAQVVVLSSFGLLNGNVGSTLYVDDLSFAGDVGTHDVQQNPVTSFYPNPATNQFNIKLNDLIVNGKLNIYDVLGNKVETESITAKNVSVNTSLFSNGLYFFRIENENGEVVSSGKFSVRH